MAHPLEHRDYYRYAVGAILLNLMVWTTHAHLPVWRSNQALWQAAVEVAPNKGRALINLAVALPWELRPVSMAPYTKDPKVREQAITLLTRAFHAASDPALTFWADGPEIRQTAATDLGMIFSQQGDCDAAAYWFTEVLAARKALYAPPPRKGKVAFLYQGQLTDAPPVAGEFAQDLTPTTTGAPTQTPPPASPCRDGGTQEVK